MKIIYSCALILFLLFTSCGTIDIAKRKYTDGYYISMINGSKNKTEKDKLDKKNNTSILTPESAAVASYQDFSEQGNIDFQIAKKTNPYVEAGQIISNKITPNSSSIIVKPKSQKLALTKLLKKYFPDQSNVENQTKTLRAEPMGIIGMVFGILSIPMFALFFFPYIFGLIAIIFGAISMAKIKRNPGDYKSNSIPIISIVTGSVGILAAIIYIVTIGSLIAKGFQW